MSDLPEVQTVVALADAFEQLRGGKPDPADADHRRGLELLVARLAGVGVITLIGVSGWTATDPLSRYTAEQRQQGLQTLGAVTAALVGAVGGYSAKR